LESVAGGGTPVDSRFGGIRSDRREEGQMARTLIENVVDIDKPPGEVFEYASDHTNEQEWNPKIRSVRKLTEGPIDKGTQYEMEFVPGRPVVVTCIRFDRPNRWEAVGDTRTKPASRLDGFQAALADMDLSDQDRKHPECQTYGDQVGLLVAPADRREHERDEREYQEDCA
jgi:hypothetical protein